LTRTVEKDLDLIYLYPAAMEVPKGPRKIQTILGSCVAVCIFDQVTKSGGINHYMLPYWNGKDLASPKYGNIAIERLVSSLLSTGSKKEHLIAKVFGGAAVINTAMPSFNIGEKNIAVAFEMLHDLKIPVVAKSTGGQLGRKIIFNTATGEIIHRFIKPDDVKKHGPK
jgi:chemotaxis protein CheD